MKYRIDPETITAVLLPGAGWVPVERLRTELVAVPGAPGVDVACYVYDGPEGQEVVAVSAVIGRRCELIEKPDPLGGQVAVGDVPGWYGPQGESTFGNPRNRV